jgi:hypothetical protein
MKLHYQEETEFQICDWEKKTQEWGTGHQKQCIQQEPGSAEN